MKANAMCFSCQLGKREKMIRQFPDDEKKEACMLEIVKVLYEHGFQKSAPWVSVRLKEIVQKYYGIEESFEDVKHKYNLWMLEKEERFEQAVRNAADPIEASIKYVCAANYIDFSAVENVSEETLQKLFDKAESETLDQAAYAGFRKDLEAAKTLVYLTDNCGEIVLDKVFIRMIRELYPEVEITVVVRGQNVINDATMVDAGEVGLTDLVRCIGNGTPYPGTEILEVNEETKELLDNADLIIAKGQGNFESFYDCGYNPYYLFLCKCPLFVKRFGLEQFATVFQKEENIRFAE